MTSKSVKLMDRSRKELNMAKAKILMSDVNVSNVTDDDVIYTALKKFNEDNNHPKQRLGYDINIPKLKF